MPDDKQMQQLTKIAQEVTQIGAMIETQRTQGSHTPPAPAKAVSWGSQAVRAALAAAPHGPDSALTHTCTACACRASVAAQAVYCPAHLALLPGRLRRLLHDRRKRPKTTEAALNDYFAVIAACKHYLHEREDVPPTACMVCLGVRGV